MADVKPGPVASDCPPPSEIDCIAVNKIYASCVETINMTGTFPVPHECTLPVSCSVDLVSSTCYVGASTSTGTADYSNITYVVAAVITLTCSDNYTFNETVYGTVTVPLYNPAGTTATCTILSGSCTCVPTAPGTILCTVSVCLLAQTYAAVQLLVPTYGFCTPGPCAVGPVLPCPPSPLYPPQVSTTS
jgi:hypothetical protein